MADFSRGNIMNSTFISAVITSLILQFPYFLLWGTGIFLSIYFYSRNPGKFRLSMIVFLMLLFDMIASSVFSVWLVSKAGSDDFYSSQIVFMIPEFFSSLIKFIVWGIIFIVIFSPKFNSDEEKPDEANLASMA